MSSDKFIISIVGRTNVGKSTIFNRLTKTRSAIVYNRSSVTRDIKSEHTQFFNKHAILQDTPGIYDEIDIEDQNLKRKVHSNIENAIKTSDLILFVIDAGIIDYDYNIAKLLRKQNKQVIVVCNKCESQNIANSVNAECFGFKDVFYISAEHNIGITDLEICISNIIPEQTLNQTPNQTQTNNPINIAIIGKPNVGKSTLINLILGEEKQLVADYAGLTRDVAKYNCTFNNQNICIIDTPGTRRNKTINDNLNTISNIISKNSINNADVVILMIDATTLETGDIDKMDYALANNSIQEGKPAIIAFNKLDKTPYKHNETPKFLQRLFKKNLHQLKSIPHIFISATNNINTTKLINMAIDLNHKQYIKISTKKLNDWLQHISQHEFLQSFGSRFKLKYITQTGTKPLQFTIFLKNKQNMRQDHERFLLNRFRDAFEIYDVPIRMWFRSDM